MDVKKTRYNSWQVRGMAEGCHLCVDGRKLVLYITGLCGEGCYYCPLSDKRKGKDIVWANEWPVNNVKEAIKEAKLCEAKGMGVTGGDPLMRLKRTIEYIKAFKKEFGKDFHVHLYTALTLVDEKKLNGLYDAGLDEIRFHLKLNDELWEKLLLAKKYDWDVGVEVPVFPGTEKEMKKMIDYIAEKVDFLNLNELEISELNEEEMNNRGFMTKGDFAYGVKGSERLAKKLLRYSCKYNMKVHYCTCALKDGVQFYERIKRRARNVALPTDILTNDGGLRRGVIYLEDLKPSFDYNKIINEISVKDRKKYLKELNSLKKYMHHQFGLSEGELFIDERKLRFLSSTKVVNDLKKKLKNLKLVPAIVEEYPTWDQLEIEVMFL